MKKKSLVALLAMMTISLGACSFSKEPEDDRPSRAESRRESRSERDDDNDKERAETTQEPESAAPQEEPKTGGEQDAADGAIMADFVNGEGSFTVKESFMGESNMCGVDYRKGQSYNYDQMLDVLLNGGYLEKVPVLNWYSYGLLEVPYAPGQWYSMEVGVNCEGEYATQKLLFQELDDKLYLCAAVEDYYRVSAGINRYGVVSNGGSGGAGLYGMQYYVPDPNGDIREAYIMMEAWYGFSLYEEDDYDPRINRAIEEYVPLLDDNNDFYVRQYEIDGMYYYVPIDLGTGDVEEFVSIAEKYDVDTVTQELVDEVIERKFETLGIEMDPEDLFSGDMPYILMDTSEITPEMQLWYTLDDYTGSWLLTASEVEGYFEEVDPSVNQTRLEIWLEDNGEYHASLIENYEGESRAVFEDRLLRFRENADGVYRVEVVFDKDHPYEEFVMGIEPDDYESLELSLTMEIEYGVISATGFFIRTYG